MQSLKPRVLLGLVLAATWVPVAGAEEPLPDLMLPVPPSAGRAPRTPPESAGPNDETSSPEQATAHEPSPSKRSIGKALVGSYLLPRGAGFGLLEGTVTAGLDGYKWENNAPAPLHVEARLGLRILILPFADANFGAYIHNEFGFPMRNIGEYLQKYSMNSALSGVLLDNDLDRASILSNHWDVSGGLHVRFFGYGSGNFWRGLFLTFGYRGAVWGIPEHGFEAGFGVELWHLRLGGSWYRSLSGPYHELGGQFFGVRLEWRFLQALRGIGI